MQSSADNSPFISTQPEKAVEIAFQPLKISFNKNFVCILTSFNNFFCSYSNMFLLPRIKVTIQNHCAVCHLHGTQMTHREGAQVRHSALACASLFCWGLNCYHMSILPAWVFPETQRAKSGRKLGTVTVNLQGKIEKVIGPRVNANSSCLISVY